MQLHLNLCCLFFIYKGPDHHLQIKNFQGGHLSGKFVREILNTNKVREKSGNFIILAQNTVYVL